MNFNDSPGSGIPIQSDAKKREPTQSVARVAGQLLTVIGLLVALAVAPAIVIAAWRFFL